MANVANLRINAVVVDQASPALKRINQALNGLNSGLSGTSGGALGAARALTNVGGGANLAAVGLGVAVAATAALVAGTYQLVKASVSAAAEVEGYRNTFIRLTGDATKADAILSKLQDFADWSPFDDQAVMKSAQMLLGAGVQAEAALRQAVDAGVRLEHAHRLHAQHVVQQRADARGLHRGGQHHRLAIGEDGRGEPQRFDLLKYRQVFWKWHKPGILLHQFLNLPRLSVQAESV